MGKKTKFLLIVLALIGQFIGIKAAIIPFFILFRICCNAIFGILLVSALAIVLAGGTLNVTLALKPRQKVLLKFALGQVFVGFFDNFKVLLVLPITLFSQSGKILLPATTIRAGILEDGTTGSSPTLGFVGALFSHFRKADL